MPLSAVLSGVAVLGVGVAAYAIRRVTRSTGSRRTRTDG
jgi:hypothetical protein